MRIANIGGKIAYHDKQLSASAKNSRRSQSPVPHPQDQQEDRNGRGQGSRLDAGRDRGARYQSEENGDTVGCISCLLEGG